MEESEPLAAKETIINIDKKEAVESKGIKQMI